VASHNGHASLIRVQENAERLVMSVTSGRNCGESFAKLNQDGFWVKTSQGSVQVRMDGSSGEYCETWPRWGILSDGVVGELRMLEPAIEGNGSSLLPTILGASTNPAAHGQSNGTFKQEINRRLAMLPTCTSRDHKGGTVERVENGNPKRALDCEMQVHGLKLQPAFAEWMQGFPEGWTALDASEMPSSRSKSTRSSKRLQKLKEEQP
jgi:DNA (cytosine-5)-methyltransferase 1